MESVNGTKNQKSEFHIIISWLVKLAKSILLSSCILMLPLSPSSRVTLRMSQKKIDVNLSTSLPWDFSRFICSDDWGGKKPLGLSHFCLFNFFFVHFLRSKTYFEESHGNQNSIHVPSCQKNQVRYFFGWFLRYF